MGVALMRRIVESGSASGMRFCGVDRQRACGEYGP
jgi:hypothetical protein